MACDEMDLYMRYLDAYEEAKRRAQPWECEVTVFPQNEDASAAEATAPKAQPQSSFKCDETE